MISSQQPPSIYPSKALKLYYYTTLGALLIPISTFHPSSTAGHTNQSPPTANGPSQPAIRGRILDFAQRNVDAVPTVPKMGTGRGWMTRVSACNIFTFLSCTCTQKVVLWVVGFWLWVGNWESGWRTKDSCFAAARRRRCIFARVNPALLDISTALR